jgi:arylsulfatase A-like enzyme
MTPKIAVMNFRNLLATTALVASVLPSALPQARAATPPSASAPRPYNVVFVLVDDLRFDAMGFLTPGLQTPNIDFLAKNGTYFPNAVVTSSLCSPSRATILTGQTARNHGVVDNNNSSEAGLTFFPSYLQQAGYQTAFVGKWHMGSDTDTPRPGFNHWVSFKAQGTYFPDEQLSPARRAAGERQMLNVDGKEVKRTGYITDELTDYAMDWLQHGRDPTKPFFLYLSHKAVHSEAMPPDRYKTQYANMDIKLPASMANTPQNNRGKPRWVLDTRNSWHGVEFVNHADKPMTEMVRQYYRTLTPVDDSVGRILAYLRANRLEKNTMIVFYSDNGFLFGDHGLIDKRNAYEPSVRVPMVVYAPGLVPKGVTNPALVRNLDLAPTFLDLAHVPRPAQMEGTSFLSLAEGKTSPRDWKPGDFIYEYYWEWNFPQTPTTFAIERDRVKYIQYHGIWDTEEIYDLNKDPEEMNNLIDDPAYEARKQTLRAALYQGLANNKGQHALPYTARTGTGAGLRNRNGTRAADFPDSWYIEPNKPGDFRKMFGIGLEPSKPTAAVPEAPSADKPSLPNPASGKPAN